MEKVGNGHVRKTQEHTSQQPLMTNRWNGRQVQAYPLFNVCKSFLVYVWQKVQALWNNFRLSLLNLGNTRATPKTTTSVTRQKLLIGLGLTTLIGIAIMTSISTYIRHQNGKITEISCRFFEKIDGVTRDFNYYKSRAENLGQAPDQYCLARMFATGNGTVQSLKEARMWYKKAADQGLSFFVEKELCQPSMFESKFALGDWYSEYWPLCCPGASFHRNHICPWYEYP